MLNVDIPGKGTLALEHLVLDVNGTIACDGRLVEGLAHALTAVANDLRVVAITADTHGTAATLREQLDIDVTIIERGDEAAQKHAFVEALGPASVVAVGNGANDRFMLESAAVGIAVVGCEGASVAAVGAADVVVFSVIDALGLLASPARLVATLRD